MEVFEKDMIKIALQAFDDFKETRSPTLDVDKICVSLELNEETGRHRLLFRTSDADGKEAGFYVESKVYP